MVFICQNLMEPIIVVMDGGGGQEFHCYQEIESIYLMNKNDFQENI